MTPATSTTAMAAAFKDAANRKHMRMLKPTAGGGYAFEPNARAAAKAAAKAAGFKEPRRYVHFDLHSEPGGKFGWKLLTPKPPEPGTPQVTHATKPWPPTIKFKTAKGWTKYLATSGFSRRENAMRSALKWCKLQRIPNPQVGVSFKLIRQGKTWAWHPPSRLPPDPKLTTRTPAKPAEPQGEPMQPAITLAQPITEQPRGAREPTRDERRVILDALDMRYDTDAQRYRDDYSDARISELLQYPMVWVATIREQLYGDHDRNEAATQHAAKLEAAIATAEAATARLLEMAAEAEKIAGELKAARERLA